MIPKVIHYCWLSGDPVPKSFQDCMDTWKKHLPDYEFKKWDFGTFDIDSSIWVKEAFEKKKYAFAADYIRMYALYTEGGIYLDMDVEVLKPYDNLLDLDYFICYENNDAHAPEVASFGAEKGCKWVGMVLDYYKDRHFVCEDGTLNTMTLPLVTKTVLLEKGMTFMSVSNVLEASKKCDSSLKLLPFDYFSPKSYATGKITKTKNTYSIHQFGGTWLPWAQRVEREIWLKLGLKPHRIMWHVSRIFSRNH